MCLPSDPLGQTVENAIVMFKNKSRVAPSVTSIPTVPLGRCSMVVVGSEHLEDVCVTKEVEWGRLVGAM